MRRNLGITLAAVILVAVAAGMLMRLSGNLNGSNGLKAVEASTLTMRPFELLRDADGNLPVQYSGDPF
jgi:hypothetical protein